MTIKLNSAYKFKIYNDQDDSTGTLTRFNVSNLNLQTRNSKRINFGTSKANPRHFSGGINPSTVTEYIY